MQPWRSSVRDRFIRMIARTIPSQIRNRKFPSAKLDRFEKPTVYRYKSLSIRYLQLNKLEWHGLCIRVHRQPIKYMKKNTLPTEGFESTYALLVRSEEKERGMFEGAAYLVFILSAVFSIWQTVQQPVALPKGNVIHTTYAQQSVATQQRI